MVNDWKLKPGEKLEWNWIVVKDRRVSIQNKIDEVAPIIYIRNKA
jgi:hypothetical protein